MTDKTASWIAALERARAELESALEADGGADTRAQELASNPVYQCWERLNRTIEGLTQTLPAPSPRRVELRHVLERLRSGAERAIAPRPEEGDQAGPAATAGGATPPPWSDAGPDGPPAGRHADAVDPEEAIVTFVVRAPVRPAPGTAVVETRAPRTQPPPAQTPDPDGSPGFETQVTIVRHAR